MVNEVKAMETEGKNLTDLEPPIIRDPAYETDVGNARRLVDNMKGDGRYCHPWKSWVFWTGKRWERDNTGQIVRCAKATVQKMREESETIGVSDLREKHLRHATVSESFARIMAMIRLAESELGVPILPDEMDKDPWLFNVQNGTLDLRAIGTPQMFREPDKKDLITKTSPAPYDPKATAPTWLKFLDDIFEGNENIIGYIKRKCGYILTGITREEELDVMYGTGGNGKGKLTNTIIYIMGDYHKKANIETIQGSGQQRNGSAASPDVSRLAGARLVTCSEPEMNTVLNESRIKDWTGRDPVTARGLNENPFTFTPEFKLWIYTNYPLIIRGQDEGIWRRLKQIPFEVTIPEERRDKDLDIKLQAEASGILNWMIEGCLEWQKVGLKVPDEIIQATAEYKEEMDILSEFINLWCEKDDSAYVTHQTIYQAYQIYCQVTNQYCMTPKAFSAAMQERMYKLKRVKGHRVVMRIRLNEKALEAVKNPTATPLELTGSIATPSNGNVSDPDFVFERAAKLLKETWDNRNKPELDHVERLKESMRGSLMEAIEELDEAHADKIIEHYFKARQW